MRTFLTSRKEGFPYDGILTDNAEILADMQLPDIPVKSFAELGYDFEVDGKIQLFLEAILFPLVIIDQLNVGDLFRIYEMVQSPITLVNLHTGLG